MRWAAYDPTDFLLTAGALTPTVRLTTHKGMALVGCLPTAYTTAPAWQGINPKQLLQGYVDRQLVWRLGPQAADLVYQRLTSGEVDNGVGPGEEQLNKTVDG